MKKKFKVTFTIMANDAKEVGKHLVKQGIKNPTVEPYNPDEESIKRLGEVISNDEAEDDEAIIAFLRRAKGNTLYKSAHGHEFKHKGRTVEIIMWEPCENWTIGQLVKHVL
jgi:hypothetical protein